MKEIKILWIDDEIDLLRAQVIFLQQKGFSVDTAYNGDEALDLVNLNNYDIIFLDENIPGMSGLEILDKIKINFPSLPIVMITKSEEENIMDQAIGGKISDYLIKPVNPNQILLTIKKNIDSQRLVSENTTSKYQSVFSQISMDIAAASNLAEWKDVYKNIVYWETELENLNDTSIDEIIKMQKIEANSEFAKFISKNYKRWFNNNNEEIILNSSNIFKNKLFKLLENDKKVFVILMDNLRFDQWKVLQPEIRKYFYVDDETIFSSILPTSTQYARNAMFAGLMPSEIKKLYPNLWLDDKEEGGKNLNEEDLLNYQIKRNGLKISTYYNKILNNNDGKKIVDNLNNILTNQLSVVVFNFIDMLSHARTEMQMIKELANNEKSYRALTSFWFKHSSLLELLKNLSEKNIKVVITTDHGTINVKNAVKVIGLKDTTTNLRYKQGKNLNYNKKEVFEVTNPEDVYLPKTSISSAYIFARNDDFFAYPNNFNHYVKYYKNTFQHGGVSLEEMLIPFITLSPR